MFEAEPIPGEEIIKNPIISRNTDSDNFEDIRIENLIIIIF